jgi:hypothetical protein
VTKPGSPAGNLTVGGDAIGKAGGPPAPVVIPPDSTADNSYVAFLDDPLLFFPQPGQGEHVQLSLEGTGSVPAMPVTSLTATVLDHVTVTVPVPPDAGDLPIDSTKAFALKWDVADAGAAAPRVVAQFQNMFNAKKVVDIVCSWPLSAGQATIPASFLAAVKAQAGEIEGGQIVLYLGDAKEATSAAHSYTIVLARDPSAELGAPGVSGAFVLIKERLATADEARRRNRVFAPFVVCPSRSPRAKRSGQRIAEHRSRTVVVASVERFRGLTRVSQAIGGDHHAHALDARKDPGGEGAFDAGLDAFTTEELAEQLGLGAVGKGTEEDPLDVCHAPQLTREWRIRASTTDRAQDQPGGSTEARSARAHSSGNASISRPSTRTISLSRRPSTSEMTPSAIVIFHVVCTKSSKTSLISAIESGPEER